MILPSDALMALLAARDGMHNARLSGSYRMDRLARAKDAFDQAVYAMARRAQLGLPATETPLTPSERHSGN